MRRFYLNILTITLFGCLFLCQVALYGATTKRPLEINNYPAVSMYMPSILRSPLNMLFPFESFSHEVCRRPAFSFSFPLPQQNLMDFQYSGTLFKTSSMGTNYIQVNEKLIFRKGNSYLLLPHVLILPMTPPGLNRPSMPTMSLPRPD